MSKIDTGGYAFPAGVAATTNANHEPIVYDSDDRCAGGMTLRDWMAGLIVQGCIVNEGFCERVAKYANLASGDDDAEPFARKFLAEYSYNLADAMIAEKRRTEQ